MFLFLAEISVCFVFLCRKTIQTMDHDFNYDCFLEEEKSVLEDGRIPGISEDAKTRYIDLKSDFGFKKIFGKPVNKDFLIDLLNNLIRDGRRVKDVTYLNTEMKGLSADSKDVVFDVQCRAEDGSVFIVEMQRQNQRTFRERTLYYSTFAIQEQIKRGDDEFSIPPVYVVCILDFALDHRNVTKSGNNSYLVSGYSLRNDEAADEVMTDSLHFVYLELGRFIKQEGELETDLDRWCFVLKSMQDLRERPVIFQKEIFRRLFEAAEVEKLSVNDRIQYEKVMTTERDLRNQLAYAREQAIKEGLAEGKARGIAQGMAQGLAEGKARGMAQGRYEQAVSSGKAMLSLGLSRDVIAKCTGLTPEEIDAL